MSYQQSAVIVLFSILTIAVASTTSAAPVYKSLQDYCESTNVDTAKNCACGQATADKIMSAEEKSMALEMMTNREQAQAKMARMEIDKVRAFTEKMRRVTSGCAGSG